MVKKIQHILQPELNWIVCPLILGCVLFFGNVHIIGGEDIDTQIAKRESFGFSEMYINVDVVNSMANFEARVRHPLGYEVLKREGLLVTDEEKIFRAFRKIMVIEFINRLKNNE